MKIYKESSKRKFKMDHRLAKKVGEKRVENVRDVLNDIAEIAEKEFDATVSQILELPGEAGGWEHKMAVLIGQARAHRTYKSLLTVEEKES